MHEKIQPPQFQLDITDVIYILHRKHRQQNATDNKLGSKPEYSVEFRPSKGPGEPLRCFMQSCNYNYMCIMFVIIM